MDKMTPEQLGIVIAMGLSVIFGRMLWDWRWPIIEAWLSRRKTRTVSTVSSAPIPAQYDHYVTQYPDNTSIIPQTAGLSGGLSGLSARSEDVPSAVRDITLYRTREQLIAALVAAGWGVGEIRSVLRGDNGKIGEEIAAARARLGGGVPSPEPARTPLAGRPIPPGIRFSDDLNEALGEE